MKLPEWGNLLRELTDNEAALAEAIVRDCANTCLQVGATTREGPEMAEHCEQVILARYGLEPQP